MKKLVFIHLSDIHFSKSKLGEPYDLDSDLRSRLEADANSVSNELGSPDAILISGDIAFSGAREQYDIAKQWLDEGLCLAVNGDPASIWTVSGNHDIDQNIIRNKPSYKDLRNKLRTCEINEIEKLIHLHLSEPELFYSPIEEYNKFAFELGCDVNVEKPIWNTDNLFKLNDGSILKIFGLNSVLISDDNDHIDTGKMVLGEYQAKIPIEDGVENLILCHHPPDWLRDCDKIKEILNPRCRIQLFGHKHKHGLDHVNNSLLQIAAGAVHPSRSEMEWEPRYNWISIWVENTKDQRIMKVNVYPRIWHKTDQSFKADYNNCEEGNNHKHYSLKLRPFSTSSVNSLEVGVPDQETESGYLKSTTTEENFDQTKIPESKDSRGNEIMNVKRALARRYLQLGYAKKMAIATKLKLLNDDDDQLTDHERQTKHLERANTNGLLSQLWESVEAAHGDGRYPSNPFTNSN